MALIGYIAPNEEMLHMAKTILDRNDMRIAVEMSGSDLGVVSASRLIEKGARVLIARGGAALLIRSTFNIPVIEISVTFADIANAVLAASKLGSSIAIIGFSNILKGLELWNPLLTVELEQVYISRQEEIEIKILQLQEKGIQVIIGGKLQCAIAQKHNMKHVLLQSGVEALQEAFQEAENILASLSYERQRVGELKAILDQTREGYVAINQAGKITLANRMALSLIGNSFNEVVDRPLERFFPGLQPMISALHTGEGDFHDITTIGSSTVLYNLIPIVLDDRVVAVVASFQDVYAVQEAESKIRNRFLQKGWYASYTFSNILGKSKALREVIEWAKKFADSEATLVLTGESGVGKELFAQGIHNESPRRKGPFVGVNCAALPESILESELFGYAEGAFTGARRSGKPGLFEMAHEGTLFLDEVSEIPLSLQARLLRVLQEKKVMRLGGSRLIPVDVRVIAASNQNLALLVAQKTLREDLFFRLNVLPLHIPPLRERKEDIFLLIQHFLAQHSKSQNELLSFSPAVWSLLQSYPWPGNIRELKNLMERISILFANESLITESQIKPFFKENEPLLYSYTEKESCEMCELDPKEIFAVLQQVHGNKGQAAKRLGIHRSTLWRWLKKYQDRDPD